LHRHVKLNDKVCNIPSLLVKAGDKVSIAVRERSRRKGQAGGGEGSKRKRNAPGQVRQLLQDHAPTPPDWLERLGTEPPEGSIKRLPARSDVDPRINEEINEQLIIEFCSR
jgi:small subunit ribosomal protein S4